VKVGCLTLLLAVAGAVGYVVYQKYYALPYGATAEEPLGKLAAVDKVLRETIQLQRQTYEGSLCTLPFTPGVVPGRGVYAYRDAKHLQKERRTESIHVSVDEKGKILAIGGCYHLSAGNPWTATGGVSRFLLKLRKRHGGSPEPTFQLINLPGKRYKDDTFTANGITIRWRWYARDTFAIVEFKLADLAPAPPVTTRSAPRAAGRPPRAHSAPSGI